MTAQTERSLNIIRTISIYHRSTPVQRGRRSLVRTLCGTYLKARHSRYFSLAHSGELSGSLVMAYKQCCLRPDSATPTQPSFISTTHIMMPITTNGTIAPALSICITTFNRAQFIGATLDSILPQISDACEIIILDGGSTDDTEIVLSEYVRHQRRIRYIRQDTNNGFDRDCDRAVELAHGEYCWLMTDDDLLKSGAIDTVLNLLSPDVSAVFVNVQEMDLTMSKILLPRRLDLYSNRTFASNEMDLLFLELGEALMYVGSVVIRRSVWMQRERRRYYDTSFVFVGVVFQSPLPGNAVVVADPLISYRRGNLHAWTKDVLEIIWGRWPRLISLLSLSDSVKAPIREAKPWRDLHTLLLWRAMGSYSLKEYQRWVKPQSLNRRQRLVPIIVAWIPGVLINTLMVFYYSITNRQYRRIWSPGTLLEDLRISPFYFRKWRSTWTIK